jgi:hypothetical protein
VPPIYGIDRWPARGAVERRQVHPHVAEVYKVVDGPEHMARRHVFFEREFVEQRPLPNLPIAHHRLHSNFDSWSQRASAAATSEFFNMG